MSTTAADREAESTPTPPEVHLQRLEHALTHRGPSTPLSVWRWAVLQRMLPVRESLVRETELPTDWLAARRSRALRERNALLGRMSELRFRVMGDPDVERATYEMRRLVVDVRHYLQRLHDLAYDEVEAELGGSE
ncbi:hypothetical protein [Nocardioides solisilvae]|uniref:hypothetical protein n=1 Tax=Nocardioides solisilvae TaxID=1542435 RepID=UPI000D74F8A1|nr:hypothetical protein [Nocardioides solisilvae]